MSDNWGDIEVKPDAASILFEMYKVEKRKREKVEKEFSQLGKDIAEATGCLYDTRDPVKLAAETLAELKRYEEKYGPLDGN